ncbi:MAG: ATP-binding protein [Saprospiraceae bacterium]
MSRIVILSIGLIFMLTNLNAQQNTDSLKTLLETKLHDTTRLNILYDLANEFSMDDLDQSILYSKQLFELSEATNNDIKLAEAYKLLSMSYFQKQNPLDSILQFAQEGLEVANRTGDLRLQNDLRGSIALMLERSGQYKEAFILFQEIINTSLEAGLKVQAMKALSNAALIPWYKKDYKTVNIYYFRALEIAKELGQAEFEAVMLNNVAEVYKELNLLDSALIYFNKSIEINKKLNRKAIVSYTLAHIGSTYGKLKKYNLANTYFKESYDLAKANKFDRMLAINRAYFIEVLYNQKKYQQAIDVGIEGLEYLGENGHISRKAIFYEYLSLNYEKIGNYKQALEYRKEFQTVNDSIFNVKKNEQLQSVEVKYKVQQKEVENAQLKAKQENAQKTIKNQALAAIGLLLALLSAIGWGFFVYRSNLRKKKLNAFLERKVKERTEALEKANKNLEQANYELRTFSYIASHDIKEPIRVISGYASLIFKKLPNDLKGSLDEYFDTIKRSTSQLYTLIEDFARYTTLSKDEVIEKESVDLNELTFSVINALQETIQKSKGQIEISELPTIQSTNSLLFATLKNLIENGLKYNKSENPTVNIDYNQTKTHHEIIISDNGIGIKKEYHQKIFEMFKRLHNRGAYEGSGIGLAIVKLSVEKLGGTVNLESEKGKGSRFVIELPLV